MKKILTVIFVLTTLFSKAQKDILSAKGEIVPITYNALLHFDYIFTGQSNAVGYGTEAFTYATHPRALSFDSSNKFAVGNPAIANLMYINSPNWAIRNNTGWQFALEFVKQNLVDTPRMLTWGQGGLGTWEWTGKTTGPGEVTTSNLGYVGLNARLSAAPADFKAKLLIWQQGEGDENNYKYFLTNIMEIYDSLRGNSKVDSNFVFAIIYPDIATYDNIKNCLDSIEYQRKNIGDRNIIVVPHQYKEFQDGVGTHWTNAVLTRLGKLTYHTYKKGFTASVEPVRDSVYKRDANNLYAYNIGKLINGSTIRWFAADSAFDVYRHTTSSVFMRWSMMDRSTDGSGQELKVVHWNGTKKGIGFLHDSYNGSSFIYRNGFLASDSSWYRLALNGSSVPVEFGENVTTFTQPITTNSPIVSTGVTQLTNTGATATPLLIRTTTGGSGTKTGIDYYVATTAKIAGVYGIYDTTTTYQRTNGGNVGMFAGTDLANISEVARFTASKRMGLGVTAPLSTLHIAGSMALPYVEKTTTYTATDLDHTINCTSGTFTVTIPNAGNVGNRIYIIKNTGAGTITVSSISNIDGGSLTLTTGKWAWIQGTGSTWITIANN